jgi:hypothetical protein
MLQVKITVRTQFQIKPNVECYDQNRNISQQRNCWKTILESNYIPVVSSDVHCYNVQYIKRYTTQDLNLKT